MLEFFAIVAVEINYLMLAYQFIIPETKESRERQKKGDPTWKEAIFGAALPVSLGIIVWTLCQVYPETMEHVTITIYVICAVLSVLL